MKTAPQLWHALDEFDTRHGSVVTNALSIYAEQMRETAREAEAAACCPEPPPEPPRQNADGSTTISLRPTPGGFARMAVMFTEAAGAADAAREAYEKLTGDLED